MVLCGLAVEVGVVELCEVPVQGCAPAGADAGGRGGGNDFGSEEDEAAKAFLRGVGG